MLHCESGVLWLVTRDISVSLRTEQIDLPHIGHLGLTFHDEDGLCNPSPRSADTQALGYERTKQRAASTPSHMEESTSDFACNVESSEQRSSLVRRGMMPRHRGLVCRMSS